uniref:Uncharacterized protein n=1 Tax=Strombidium inclinatum TaxID=197538 RepID=A0A7S3MXC2_9SPIT
MESPISETLRRLDLMEDRSSCSRFGQRVLCRDHPGFGRRLLGGVGDRVLWSFGPMAKHASGWDELVHISVHVELGRLIARVHDPFFGVDGHRRVETSTDGFSAVFRRNPAADHHNPLVLSLVVLA